jgi:hypothetical protein
MLRRIHLNCSGKLIPAIYTIVASLFPLSDDWLSAITYLQREPHENGEATFFVLSRWKQFLKFKGRGPFKFSKKYPAAKHYTDIYRLVLLLTHLSFCWTVPLSLCITAISIQIRTLYITCYTVVGKLLLKSSRVTLLSLLVKVTRCFWSLTYFSL